MRKERTRASVFGACVEEGSFLPLAAADSAQIRGMLTVAIADLETVQEWRKKAPLQSGQWNAIYKLAYDVLHSLSEAFLMSEKVKARTHECVFAYLCEKHPELELDWNFFEKVRTMRNRSLYYGEPATHEHWKGIELQMLLYISALKKAIEARWVQFILSSLSLFPKTYHLSRSRAS